MEDSKRLLLERGQSILLRTDARDGGEQEYLIQSVSGTGRSTVCYDAIRIRDGQHGILREFYPGDSVPGGGYDYLQRLPDGQLVPREEAGEKFCGMCEAYLSAHRVLAAISAEHPRNQVLKNYTRNTQVLHGTATVYIWSPGTMGQNLDEFLDDVRKSPQQGANVGLLDVLSAIRTVTDCVHAIHGAGWILRDITPGSFTVPFDRKKGIDVKGISLFEVGRLYSLSNGGEDRRIFWAPEAEIAVDDVRADVYALGAMLFRGLVVLKNVPEGLYRIADYPHIDRMVRHSALIKNSTAGTILVSLIANIIKKCLATNPDDRYEGCGPLLQDLDKAVEQAKSNAGSPKSSAGRKKADEQVHNSPGIVIQKMLYDHPLYEALRPGERKIDVLVIGSGTYGQKFIDLCLQAGQMKGYDLSITAASGTPEEDRLSYLQFRPGLSRFVNVNGAMEDPSAAYGSVRFVSLNEACGGNGPMLFARGSGNRVNRQIVQDMICESVRTQAEFDYIFVALGRTTLNRDIAKLFESELREQHLQCPICYISEQVPKKKRVRQESMLYPVYINEPITPETITPLLEQMAFNADIAWSSSLNMDVKDAFEAFRQNEYRYESSLAYALSIPYKLFSIGIVIQNHLKPFGKDRFPGFTLAETVSEAADCFAAEVLSKKSSDEEARAKFNTLVYLEHRRWVLNRVCESWDAPRDENGRLDLQRCVDDGKVKNEARQTHPCIVFSTEAAPLSSEEYTKNGHQKWNDPDIDPNLDELDRMSLELHQLFRKRAEEIRKDNPLQRGDIPAIETVICTEDDRVVRAYKQLLFCLKNILNGVESYTRQFDYYKSCFTDELSRVSPAVKKDVESRLERISEVFKPVMEANKYHDYKATDETLVEKLPFILTYRFQDTLALAFEDGKYQNGRNDAVFANVAAATVLCPEQILYLYNFTPGSKPAALIDKLSAVVNYLGKRRVHCKVSMVIALHGDISESVRKNLCKGLNKLQSEKQADANASFAGYEIFAYRKSEEAIGAFLDCLQAHEVCFYDGSTALFHSVLDNTSYLTQLLQTDLPYFEFDRRSKKFTSHRKCDYLQYIHDNSSIRIHDMFALMNAEDTQFNLPEFADDYLTLWNIYAGEKKKEFQERVSSWNQLCGLLEQYESEQKPLATLQLSKEPDAQKKTLVYLLPEYTYKTVKTIVSKLVEYGAVEPDASVAGYTSENCRVELTANATCESEFDKLFARPELLLGYYGVNAVLRVEGNHRYIRFEYRNMKVDGLNLNGCGYAKWTDLLDLLKKLQEHHYICRLTQDPNTPSVVSFEYAAPRIRKLLTSAGAILEVYTYYQILSTGYFDDVACGYEFRWQRGGVKSELDIVATKGFRSIMIECKAVQKMEGDHYHKFHSIAEHFGIGTTKVVIGNTYRDTEQINAVNEMQQKRGEQLEITTISNKDKIKKIGNTLMEMMQSS